MTDQGGCIPDTPSDLDFAIQRFAKQRARTEEAEYQLAEAYADIKRLQDRNEGWRKAHRHAANWRYAETDRADKAERQLAYARKEIECLRRLCEEFREERDKAQDQIGPLENVRLDLEDQIAKTRAALEPFASFDCEDFPDNMRLFEDTPRPTMGDMRRAHEVMKAQQGEQG